MSRKRTNTSSSHDANTLLGSGSCKEYNSLNSRIRRGPIAGGSWDDNSVGHGSVAARMRRERNLAIRRTQPNSTYSFNSRDTQASITSTLNLINTTALSPWAQNSQFPWDEGYETGCYNNQIAASQKTAGSLCNINMSESRRNWDSSSIPDYHRHPLRDRVQQRLSFTTGQHHSSPTSGCASIASSDIDSADLAFFSMTDDSSYFDGDSLFSDSYGMFEGDSGFSTNIFSLLEEGSINCRTPFPNEDWPDSISELDFDCNVPQSDISNCDAHSDIGPSCSAATDRNKLKKRHIRTPSSNSKDLSTVTNDTVLPSIGYNVSDLTEVIRRQIEVGVNANLKDRNADNFINDVLQQGGSDTAQNDMIISSSPNYQSKFNKPHELLINSDKKRIARKLKQEEQDDMSIDQFFVKSSSGTSELSHPNTVKSNSQKNEEISYSANTDHHILPRKAENTSCLPNNNATLNNTFSKPAALKFTLNLSTYPSSVSNNLIHSGPNDLVNSQYDSIYPTLNPLQSLQMQVDSIGEGKLMVRPCPNESNLKKPKPKIVQTEKQLSAPVIPILHKFPMPTDIPQYSVKNSQPPCVKDWNIMTKDERLGFIEQLTQNISTTMGLQEQMDIIQIIGANKKNCVPFSMSIDDIDSHKLARVLGYMGNHLRDCTLTTDSQAMEGGGVLRRSNSDGNIAKSTADAQKEKQRKDQRQARRFAKWLKQRQRKENRQHKKEQKSGLFLKEQKLKLEVASEEEIDIDI